MSEKPGDEMMESVLEGLALAEPSKRLDERMKALLAPPAVSPARHWLRGMPLITHMTSFAAGLLMAAVILMLHGQASSGPAVSKDLERVAPGTPAAAETPIEFVAQSGQTTDELTGTIDGVPVVLERTRRQITLRPRDLPGGATVDVVLPETITVAEVDPYGQPRESGQ